MRLKAHPSFAKDLKGLAKKYPSIVDDYAQLLADLQDHPTQGAALGRDCFKVRMPISAKGRGKSGGARVITCVKIVNDTLHLLAMYDKSEKSTLNQKELTLLLKQLEQ